MRVFVTCGKHPLKSSGGYASYTHGLCKCLKSMGYDVNIIAISDKNGLEETDIGKIHTVTSSYLSSKSSTSISGAFFLWSRIIDKKLRELIRNEKDSCMIYGIGPWGYAGLGSKKLFEKKVLLVTVFFTSAYEESYWLMKSTLINDYGLLLKIKYLLIHLYARTILRHYEKLSFQKSDQVIVHYDFAKKILMDEYQITQNKINKIPYYIELYNKNILYKNYDKKIDSQKYNKLTNKKFTVISVCRQEPRKGINYFIRALKILKEKGIPVKATIIGSGDLLQKNMELAQKLNVDDIAEFTGFLPDISKKLSEAEVFVLPSLQEGSGSISVFEALKYGVPVIATNCDGLPEDIQDDVSGILVPKRDYDKLANAIIRLYTDKALINKLISNGKKVIEEKLDISKMKSGLEVVHKKLYSTIKQ